MMLALLIDTNNVGGFVRGAETAWSNFPNSVGARNPLGDFRPGSIPDNVRISVGQGSLENQ
jgi:hypothetical protein